MTQPATRIPVILDTDIGGDIDDAWALAYLLKCPELDLRFVSCAMEDTAYKARLVARLLAIAGRTDIPVGIGVPTPHDLAHKTHAAWIEGYRLSSYRGTVHANGVAALVRAIHEVKGPVSLVAIGPLRNIAEALKLDPTIAGKCDFIGMHGSIRRNFDGKDGAWAEYNVVQDLPAAKAVFTAPWRSMTITPLDTCGNVRLTGEEYQRVRACREPLTAAVIENYRLWRHVGDEFDKRSSILFDTVAVYLAFSRDLLVMETMSVVVDDAGFTRRDPAGKPVAVALDWKDLPGYTRHLSERMLADVQR